MSASRVEGPVAATTACASPSTTNVPAWTGSAASARTGALSPVSSDVSSGAHAAAMDQGVSRDAIAGLEQEQVVDDHVEGVDHQWACRPAGR